MPEIDKSEVLIAKCVYEREGGKMRERERERERESHSVCVCACVRVLVSVVGVCLCMCADESFCWFISTRTRLLESWAGLCGRSRRGNWTTEELL